MTSNQASDGDAAAMSRDVEDAVMPTVECPPSPRLGPARHLDASVISSLTQSRRDSLADDANVAHKKLFDHEKEDDSRESMMGGIAAAMQEKRDKDLATQPKQTSSDILGMQPDNQAVMHLLSLVGSRFLEAEGSGMLTASVGVDDDDEDGDEDGSDANDIDSPSARLVASTSALTQERQPSQRPSKSQHFSRPETQPHIHRRPNVYERLVASRADDQATPRGSSTPMGTSTYQQRQDATGQVATTAATTHESDPSTSSASSASSANDIHLSIHALSLNAIDDDKPLSREQDDDALASSAGDLSSSPHDLLGQRLRRIFDLDDTESLVSCHSCWLFRGILLQGYLYLLKGHLCFYAYLPSRQEYTLKAGALLKLMRRARRVTRHWAVLRGRSLSWYESETDPFFPQDHIDLRSILEVTASDSSQFNVRTTNRTYTFDAESTDNCQAWVATLRRATFRAINEGDSVRICIPMETIIDVEENASHLVIDTVEAHNLINVKVLQTIPNDAESTVDDYQFVNVDRAEHLQCALRQEIIPQRLSRTSSIRDSTKDRSRQPVAIPRAVPISSANDTLARDLADASSTALSTSARTLKTSELTGYPPSYSNAATTEGRRLSLGLDKSSPLASLISSTSRLAGRFVQESWSKRTRSTTSASSRSSSRDSAADDLGDFSVLEDAGESDPSSRNALADFESTFSLPDEEELEGHIKASLYRVLPVRGRLYVSTNFVCFRSSNLTSRAFGRTLMILPRSEIVSVGRNSAFRYGSHGLVVIVRGHEEIFVEFASVQRRDQCIALMEHKRTSTGQAKGLSSRRSELLLTDMASVAKAEASSASPPGLASPSLSSTSMSLSGFLPAQPRPNMHFTFLTVGSRGDVQPYIALAQGLMKEGHRTRLATHPEFQSWIESYGIEFRGVGGDPAELMKICVDNGTFTLAFVREGVSRFRGWLDDLLLSCWHACQGTDVIIESPSAIAGIHIAEALGVPYYRAFTMPWSRTRAYPHAFAVPARRAGGNYNYMSYVIFDQVFWRASAGQINAWRRGVLGLANTSLDRLEPHKVPFLYNFSPSLVPKPLDWYDWIHVTGYWFLQDPTTSWNPPQDLVDFIADARAQQKKLVYIGWGSIVVADADAVLSIVLESVKLSGVRAIISRGWSDRLSEKSEQAALVPTKEVFMVDSVPHDWLFPQVDAACHHGGSGTLGASLRAGTPTIIRPFFGDQFFWASQVENLQVGRRLPQPFSAQEFADALTTCTTDERMRANARALGDKIATENGVGVAIRAVYADWDYACSRIRRDVASRVLPDVDVSPDRAGDERSDDGWSVVSGSEGDAA